MAISAKLTKSHRLTIPKDIRVALGWRPGQKLVFALKSGSVMLTPMPAHEELRGRTRIASSGKRNVS